MQTEKIEVKRINLDPEQPREVYTGIDELAGSMKSAGFLEDQAITVWRPEGTPEGEYQVIDGHRRTKAAMLANLLEIPCFVYDGISKRDVWEKQLIANSNREDLSIMNRARSFQRSIDEHGMDVGRVAKIHGMSVATVKSDLELCALAPELHKFVDDGKISKEVARKLASTGDAKKQMHIFNNFVKGMKTATKMLAAIQAYLDQATQRDIFSRAKKEAAQNGGLRKAQKDSKKLEKMIASYETKWIGSAGLDPNVVNSRKRELANLELTARSMENIAKKILERVAAFRARKEINAPKKDR